MNCANKALLVLLAVVTAGLWGCSQGNSPTGSARVRDLESRHAKLEEDYRVTVAARDQARKSLVAIEQERNQLREQLEQLTKEREDLRQQVAARTGERDNLQTQLTQFGKDLHTLLGRIDAATVQPGPPLTSAARPQAPTKS
jgi:chromosome segregation ATPase